MREALGGSTPEGPLGREASCRTSASDYEKKDVKAE